MSEYQEDYLKYLNDLDAYLKLKRKYEDKWTILKKKNLRNIQNKRKDGKTLIKNLQRKCIHCKKNGGTIFTNDKNVFIAKCGAEEKKFLLNIKIETAKYIHNNKFQKKTIDDINDIKDKIINNKLNLLFDLENDDVVINEFNSLKEELKKYTNLLKFLKKSKNDLDIVNNYEKDDIDIEDGAERKKEIVSIYKKDKIKQLKINFSESLKNFKKILKEYREGGSVKKVLLNGALNIYISNILPVLKQIRLLENNEMYINKMNKADLSEPSAEFKLVKNKYFIKNEEELASSYKIHKMNMKKKLYSVKKPKKTQKTEQEIIEISKNAENTEEPKKSETTDVFEPIELNKTLQDVNKGLESKEIKIDIEKLTNLNDNKGEDMSEYNDEELLEEREQEGLYNNDTVFKFYSRSANDKPGKGKAGGGETVSQESIGEFSELESIPQWRKVLSNFHTNKDGNGDVIPLFTSEEKLGEGNTNVLLWASVEHWYHAHKFKKNNPEYFKLFTMNSKSDISIDPRRALGAGGRTGYIKNDAGKRVLFRDASITMDDDFFNGYHKDIMEQGQRLKYNQDKLSKQVLLATKDAKLVHLETRRGQKTKLVPFFNTMKIRMELTGK